MTENLASLKDINACLPMPLSYAPLSVFHSASEETMITGYTVEKDKVVS
jgi:hypothetical protein